MQRCIQVQGDTRSQLVPNPGSPLSLETWCMADLESWLCDSTTLLRNTFNPAPLAHSNKMAYQSSMTISIPAVASVGAGSPTLYDPQPKMYLGPPPYVQVKQEQEDVDFHCNGSCSAQAMVMAMPLMNVKKEEGLSCDKIEQVRCLAVEQAAKDIHVACGVLGIASDPTMWTMDAVKSWLLWTVNQYGLGTEVINHFNMDGLAFTSLTESFFRQKIPHGGDILYAQLEIWKTAAHLQKQVGLQNQSFRPEDSVLDMSILDQWSTTPDGLPYPPPAMPLSEVSSPAASPSPSHPLPDSSSGQGADSPCPVDFNSEGVQSDDDISDESCEADRCSSRSGARGHNGSGSHSHIHLWQFLKELLCQPHLYGSCIRWLDRPKGIFKIEDSVRVARLWGKRKNRPAMNYDKLSRSIRQYYKKGIMKKTERSQRLVYQFCHPYGL